MSYWVINAKNRVGLVTHTFNTFKEAKAYGDKWAADWLKNGAKEQFYEVWYGRYRLDNDGNVEYTKK